MTLQWVAADMLTGAVIADMPGVEPQWPLTRTISDASTATATLHLDDRTSPQWERAILEGGSVLACYDDGDSSNPIIWAGVVWQAPRQAGSDDIQVSLATYESALDHAYVGTVTFATTVARDDIIASLVNNWFITPTGCSNLQLSYTAGNGTKPAAALAFQNSDNVTVKGRIDQVCAQLGGEYTVEWSWGTSNLTIVPTLVFADRIGVTS